MAEIIKDWKDFVQVHGVLLAAAGIPASLHERLFTKLSLEQFDGGTHFQVEECFHHDGNGNGRQRRLLLSSKSMAKESDIFLIDHAWSFRLVDARNQLQEVPGLAERMAKLMCVMDDSNLVDTENNLRESLGESTEEERKRVFDDINLKKYGEQSENDVEWLELEELNIDDNLLCSLELSSRFPNLVGLDLWGNKLASVEVVVGAVSRLDKLRALWLNNNPVLNNFGNVLRDVLMERLPQLEIYNSEFTEGYTQWALGSCAGIYGAKKLNGVSCSLKDVKELDLSDRCIHNLKREIFNPMQLPLLITLNLRGNPLDQNTENDLLQLLQGFMHLQSLEVDIPGGFGNSAVRIVELLPNLAYLNGVNVSVILEENKDVIDARLKPCPPEWSSEESLVDRVLRTMWLYLLTYRLADEEKLDETPVWYVMDELGSALRHSDAPNFKVVPFLFMPDGKITSAISYSVMWPTMDVFEGEECTRDYLPGIGEDKQRSARLTAWFQTPRNYFINVFEKHLHKLKSKVFKPLNTSKCSTQSIQTNNACVLRVYTDNEQVEQFLSRPEFVLVDEPQAADVIWTSTQIDEEVRKTAGLNDKQYVNQFPYESCIVMKHHLADTIQQAHGLPDWFQPTYNLETQLSELIGDYHLRHSYGRNNLWILKPWNMARTIDITITDYLPAIIRQMETGPKICQKYIEDPALFKGKKFDLRYIVLVRSMQPLEILLLDVFWVRLANKKYTIEERSLTDYETHFTVMNYGRKLTQVNCDQFVVEFEQEHNVRWTDIHAKVCSMIRAVFEGASVVHPEMHCRTARAIYGVDVMIDRSYQPKLLEVTYYPDCNRACKYDVKAVVGNCEILKGSEFFNHVFGCLFLNETEHASIL